MDEKDALFAAAGNVLEQMAFLYPELTASDRAAGNGKPVKVGWIPFDGPARGHLAIRFRPIFASTVAANMLGLDEEEPDLEVRGLDAIKELLNMMCGNILPALHGAQAVFLLGIPTILEPADPRVTGTQDDAATSISLDIEGETVTLEFLCTHDRPPAR